ncbi:MAG: class I SAM-dependent methyltransferase [Bacteroidota bacterium]
MNFDFIAPYYDRLAHGVFGDLLAQSRRVLLSRLPEAKEVLILGGGSGDMLFGLAERSIGKHIRYVEASAKFIALAQSAWQNQAVYADIKIDWIQTTWQDFDSSLQFDLITTDYLLDLFPPAELELLICKIAAQLKPEGSWLYIDFCQHEKTAWWWAPLRFIMYRFFARVAGVPGRKITNVRAIASQYGLQLSHQQTLAQNGIEAIIFKRQSKTT